MSRTRTYTSRRWTLAEPHASAAELAQRIRTSPLIAQMLLNRGISETADCLSFLRPSLKCLHDPATIPGLNPAAERVAKAIHDREKIVIYGDYDVDGITAVAILWHAIRTLGGEAHYYIPHRLEEGYGLNGDAVEQICNEGAQLIITVDCGITALDAASVASRRGVDLIITDHHEWHGSCDGADRPNLPECFAVVHPRLPWEGPTYPNPHLCGAGVAFKLAWGVGLAMSGANRVNDDFRAFLVEATALAALGTIADVVPLLGENRILAHFGLSGLKRSQLRGIRALINSSGLNGQTLDSYHVGFLLAPRLNAAGRMGHAKLAVEMLTHASEARAGEIAVYLEQQNRQRQAMERSILDEAMAQGAQHGAGRDDCRALVLAADDWHAGVIGIVASRIVDRFNRPTIMIAINGEGVGQGSGRSIAGFHLARAMECCGEHLEVFGGHEMAAGLKIRREKLDDFRSAFCEHAQRVIRPEMLVPELKLDCLAELQHVTEALVNDLKRLGPFGHGNRKPLICCRGVTLSAPPRRVGKTGDHLQLHVRQGSAIMKCIAFGAGDLIDRLTPGTTIDLAVEPQLNEFNGRVSVELEVKDLQFA
jgi:single-stranded-DNA-specific exonuclease